MTDRCNVLLVYPQFVEETFWNYKDVCEVVGAKYSAPPLGLITVAAMLPQTWTFRLVNRNTETLQSADLDWADVVMTGGMLFQQTDTLAIIALAQKHGKPVVVGGPAVTSTPEVYAAADFRVVGECEGILHRFVDDWRAGQRSGFYEAPKFKADVTTTPNPRWDLLKLDQYLQMSVQFSRGCPFTCEFCDIIELYGRAPRTKTAEQVLRELDALYAAGWRGHLDFVDDNLIGNKKAVKAFLPHLIAWQKAHNYPFELTTEASINISDDGKLLEMMQAANFFAIFIGIESPDTDTLVGMQKKQNTRRSIVESVRRIYNAGIQVAAGFIVGFDSEKGSVADAMVELIQDSGIALANVSLLLALPNTQLMRRLKKEGRLLDFETMPDYAKRRGDMNTVGLNFVTKRPRRDVLVDLRSILERLYTAEAYYGRLRDVGTVLLRPRRPWRVHFASMSRETVHFLRLATVVSLKRPDMRKEFWKTLVHVLRHNPGAIVPVMRNAALFYHYGPFSRVIMGMIDDQIAAIDNGTFVPPLLATPNQTAPNEMPVDLVA